MDFFEDDSSYEITFINAFVSVPFGRTVALGSTRPLTEMKTSSISREGGGGGRESKGAWWVKLTTLPTSCSNCHEI